MFVSKALSVNSENHLEIGGVDCLELVKQFGTPLYVLDEKTIRENCRLYTDSMNKVYDGKGTVLYACKAFCSTAICKIMEQENMGLDVVSGGELYTALNAKFPMNKVYFNGNNKTDDELRFAIDKNVHRIVVDNWEELKKINVIAKELEKTVNISFRIKPGIDAHTHEFVQTGQIDSKFGVALENGEALKIITDAIAMDNVCVKGIHCHIGSQIFDIEPFKLAAKVMLGLIKEVKDTSGHEISELSLGGGFGIKYTESDDPVAYDEYVEAVSAVVKDECEKLGIDLPFMIMEPGRSIIGPAGITLYTVGSVKDIKNVRKYVSVDGGMTDNPRYALYKSQYTAVIADRPNTEPVETVTIAGKCCESGDLLIVDTKLPKINAGDIIAVLATGAYNYSMSSNYNRIPRPPVVLVTEGTAQIIVKRETYEDIIRNDIMPESLK